MTYIELIEHCSNMGENSCADCKFEKLCDKFYEIDIDKEIINDEIIRCKDCKYSDLFVDDYGEICFYCPNVLVDVTPDDFCSWAKRKDGKNEA